MSISDKIFFSYAREDGHFALKLAQHLRAAGQNVWLDQLDIPPGSRWDHSIETALRSAGSMLVVLSQASVESQNVMDEVSFALEEGMPVIPVLYQRCQIPFRLRRLQYLDFTEHYDRGLEHLLAFLGVSDATTSPVEPPQAAPPPPQPEPTQLAGDSPSAPGPTPRSAAAAPAGSGRRLALFGLLPAAIIGGVVAAIMMQGGLPGFITTDTEPDPTDGSTQLASDMKAVPNLIGLELASAREALRERGLTAGDISFVPANGSQPGTVTEQSFKAGQQLAAGRSIDLVVAEAAMVSVPDIVGMNEDAARQTLQRRNLSIGNKTSEESNRTAGTILRQSPVAGTQLAAGSSIDLVLAEAEMISVPTLVGMDEGTARRTLQSLNLAIGRKASEESNRAPGTILRHSPAAGTRLAAGGTIDITIAKTTLPTIPSTVRLEWQGRAFTYSQVSLNGQGNAIRVRPAQDVSIAFRWRLAVENKEIYCPGCIVQLYYGLGREHGGGWSCFTSGTFSPGRQLGGDVKGVLTAPKIPGTYYVTQSLTLEYSCQEPKAKHPGKEADPFAAIVVAE